MPADVPRAPGLRAAGTTGEGAHERPPVAPDDVPLPRLSAAVLLALLGEIGLLSLLGWACA